MAGAGIDLRRAGAIAMVQAAAILWILGVFSAAQAQPSPLAVNTRAEFSRRGESPQIGRYEGPPGFFILERSNPRLVLRFDNSPEHWVLLGTRGPRGDIIYKTDAGRVMLRTTMSGGMTLFTPENPGGLAVAYVGPIQPWRPLPPISPTVLFARLATAAVRARRAAQHLITIEAETNPEGSALAADAGIVASEAIVRMSSRPRGRILLARIGSISVVEGPQPRANLRNGVLTVTITPSLGLMGRLSSDRIIAVIGG